MNENLKEKIKEIVRQVSVSRMQMLIDSDAYRISESSAYHPHGYVFANKMSLIIVAGKALKMVFKVHFNKADSCNVAKYMYGDERITEQQANDAMKEYCNLTAGYLKKICVDHNTPVGISLPVVTSGFNEVFNESSETDFANRVEDCWELGDGISNFSCSYQADILEEDDLNGLLAFEVEEEEEEGEFDFL